MAINNKNGGPINKNTADLIFDIKEQATTLEEQVETLTEEVQALNTILSSAKISVKFFTDEESSVPSGRIIVQQQGQADQSFSFDSTGGEYPILLGSVQIIPGLEASITLDFDDSRINSASESIFSNQDGDVSSQEVSYSGGSPTYSATFHSAGRVKVYQK